MNSIFERIEARLGSAKDDSDFSYFFDLINLGEAVIKSIVVFIVTSIEDDKERTRYKYEYQLVRASAIGDFTNILAELLNSPDVEKIKREVKDSEIKELMQKFSSESWEYKCIDNLMKSLKSFNIEIEKIQAKVSLLQFFSLFTLLRNKTKGHGSPTTKACSDACPHLASSILSLKSNFPSFKRTWVYLFRNLSGRYRVTYLSIEKSDHFESLKRSNEINLINGIYCYVNGYQRLSFLYTDSEISDFYFPNGNLRSNVFETLSYVSDSRKYENIDEYLVPYTSLPESHTSGIGSLEIVGKCFSNMPLIREMYIPRIELEKELESVLCTADHYPIISLVGRGGIGKTSLALKVVNSLVNNERFDLIIWFSARDVDLLEDGPKKVKANVLDKDDISKDYINLVGNKIQNKESIEYFSSQLRKNDYGKTLYIFDNFETLKNPTEIYDWLNQNIRNPNKILITSRTTRDFKADYPIEIKGMNYEQSKELIFEYSKRIGVTQYLNDEYIEDLIEESNGHPYIIKIILGTLHNLKHAAKVDRIVSDKDKVLDSLFRRTYMSLSPAAKRVLLILSCWNTFIPKIALEAALLKPDGERIDVESAIEELRRTSFIDVFNQNEEELIKLPLSSLIFARKELSVSPERFLIEEDKKFLLEFGALNKSEINNGIDSKIKNKFRVISSRVKNKEELEKEMPALQYLATNFPKAWLYLSEVYEELKDLSDARVATREYLKNTDTLSDRVFALKRLAYLSRMDKDWIEESTSYIELAQLAEIDFAIVSNIADTINSYYYYHSDKGSIEYKKIIIKKIIEIIEERIAECNATDLSKLAWLYMNINQEEDARRVALEGLKKDKDNIYCNKLIDKLRCR